MLQFVANSEVRKPAPPQCGQNVGARKGHRGNGVRPLLSQVGKLTKESNAAGAVNQRPSATEQQELHKGDENHWRPHFSFPEGGGQKETRSLGLIQQEPRASQAEVGRGEAGKC